MMLKQNFQLRQKPSRNNDMKRVLVIIGTRPEAIKMAPVIHALRSRRDIFDVRVCSTGQHNEMLYQAVEYFEINLDYDLKLMIKGQSLSQITAALAGNLPSIIEDYRPHLILVQGDTTSAFIGGLVGYYHHIQIGHVEAGLRTNNKFAPFPEEINRRLLGVLTDYHFAPTRRAKLALLKEGVKESRILVTGNTVIDALFYTLKKNEELPPSLGDIEHVVSNGRKMILITGHRRENFGDGFKNICEAIRQLALTFSDTAIVYPVHLNPNVQKPVYEILGDQKNIYLIPPLGYVPFVRLLNASHIVLTDSGGIQEEASSLGKPVLVMREVTERLEAVESGNALLVGTDRDAIFKNASRLLKDSDLWNAMSKIGNPFGDGMAADRIAEYLSNVNVVT